MKLNIKKHLMDFHNELEKSLYPFEPGLFYFLLFVVAIGIPLCIHFHLIAVLLLQVQVERQSRQQRHWKSAMSK